MTTRWMWVVAAAAALGLAACGDDDDDERRRPRRRPRQCTPPATATTYFRQDVYPIASTRCTPCHGDAATSLPKFASLDPRDGVLGGAAAG